MSIRTPLAHVRGLGTAKDGTHHWWVQRVTSVALVPLVLWFVISLLGVSHADYETFQHWLGNPYRAGLMVALLVAVLITQFVLFLLGAISIVAVLKVALA